MNDGKIIHFPLVLLGRVIDMGCCNEDVIENVLIPVPDVIDKSFFKKMSQLVGAACKCKTGTVQHPKWICEWDWYSFQDNIIEPNQWHIQLVMGLSSAINGQVVWSSNYIINDWTGEEDDNGERDEYLLTHNNFFTVEDLDFKQEYNVYNQWYLLSWVK